jgi:hypothetical protein
MFWPTVKLTVVVTLNWFEVPGIGVVKGAVDNTASCDAYEGRFPVPGWIIAPAAIALPAARSPVYPRYSNVTLVGELIAVTRKLAPFVLYDPTNTFWFRTITAALSTVTFTDANCAGTVNTLVTVVKPLSPAVPGTFTGRGGLQELAQLGVSIKD